jgi:thiol-disulfide isomerase/thioredoxin
MVSSQTRPSHSSSRRFAYSICKLLLMTLSVCRVLPAQSELDGLWNATVAVGQAEVPFGFEITHTGDQWQGFFFEGDRRIGSTSGTYAARTLHLDYEFLNVTLTATFDGKQWNGTYRYNRKNGKQYPFRARRHAAPDPDPSVPPQIAGEWEMKLVGQDHALSDDPRALLSSRLYLHQSGASVTGSILRVDGDTGTLTGRWHGDFLLLSHFAGERPVLLEARLQPDGTLDILLNKQGRFLAARTSDAREKGIAQPPDPSQYTSAKDPADPFHFRFPDVNGTIVSDADLRFHNKVVILAISGTWCPNCRDEAPFLVDLYNRYHSQGLEIVGLNFEATGDLVDDKRRILSFIKESSVPYPIFYAGAIPDVKEKLPRIVNFGAFPTTIYLGRDGRVASIHAGFASTATGEAHSALQRDVAHLVQRLLDQDFEKQVAQLRLETYTPFISDNGTFSEQFFLYSAGNFCRFSREPVWLTHQLE